MRSSRMSLLSVVSVFALTGCIDSTSPAGPAAASTAVVLNTFGAPGITLVPLDSGASRHVDFGTAFNGAALSLERDTVLAASSAFSGDQLYLARAADAAPRIIQLPSGSNPSTAHLLGADAGAAGDIIVTLRNTGQLARVRLTADSAHTTLIDAVATCPFDAASRGGDVWVLDANLNCATDYSYVGPARLIRVPLAGGARDTILFSGAVVNGVRVFADGDFAYLLAAGCSSFLTGCSAASATVAKVNLATRAVEHILFLPIGVFGTQLSVGRDGRLYVTASPESPYAPRVYVVDASTMTFVGPFAANGSERRLLKANGSAPACAAATGDAEGWIYCVENGSTAATLLVFREDGTFIRSADAGSTAADIVLR